MTKRYAAHKELTDCTAQPVDIPDRMFIAPEEAIICGTCGRPLDLIDREEGE